MPSAKKKSKNKTVKTNKELINLLYIVCLVLLILLTIYNLQKISNRSSGVLGASVEIDYQSLVEEKNYWTEILSTNPTYYDGWIRLSEIEYILQDNSSAQNAIEIAKRIDANH